MSKQFLPFLTDDQGKSLVVENGVVVTKAIPDPLDYSPEGWEKNTIQFARNNEFRGVVKSFTTTLKFFFEGAKILRTYFYEKGIEAILYFIWLKQNVFFGGGMKYEGWYKGEPDFSTFNDTYEGVEINITEGGFYKNLQANKNTPYELPFDEDAVSIEMDGMDIFNNLTYVAADDFEYESVPTPFDDVEDEYRSFAVLFPFISAEGTNFTLATNSQDYEVISSGQEQADDATNVNNYTTSSSNYFLRNVSGQNQDINLKGDLFLNAVINNGAYHAKLFIISSLGQQKVIYDSVPGENEIIKISVDETLTLSSDEKLFFVLTHHNTIGVIKFYFWPDSKLLIDFASRKETTIIKGFRAFDVGDTLCKNMNGGKGGLQSDLLGSDYNLLITCGDAIRGIENAVVKTKFNDFHKSIDAVKCISFGVQNNSGKLELREYAFTNSQVADLGECRNFKLGPANEYRYSKIEVGYPVKEIEDLNGKYSFNNTVVYKTPVLRGGENTYDAKSAYYADPYVIELLRINLEFKNTTDDKSDNDVFFIDGEKVYNNYIGNAIFSVVNSLSFVTIDGLGLNLKAGVRFKVLTGQNMTTFTIAYVAELGFQTYIQVKEGIVEENIETEIEFLHYKLRRLPYTSIEGIPSGDSVFNLELSPKRILANHYRWIASSMHKLETGKLVYQTTEKNSELATTDANNVVIMEKEDIPIAALGTKIFLPYYLNFEVETPLNLLELMTANSGGYFTVFVNGFGYNGFVVEVKTVDATLETQGYKLLATADNDFTTLINGR